MTTIGDIHRIGGRPDAAGGAFRQALTRHRDNADRAAKCYTLQALAFICGDWEEAVRLAT